MRPPVPHTKILQNWVSFRFFWFFKIDIERVMHSLDGNYSSERMYSTGFALLNRKMISNSLRREDTKRNFIFRSFNSRWFCLRKLFV